MLEWILYHLFEIFLTLGIIFLFGLWWRES